MTRPTVLALAALLAPAVALAQAAPAEKPAAAPAEKPAAKPAEKPAAKPAEKAPAKTGELYVTFVTSRGTIGVRLLPDRAPKAVENFVALAQGKKPFTDPETGAKVQKPLYDGTLFHRVIQGFMVQGGDPLTRGAKPGETRSKSGRPFGTGDPGYRFDDELDAAARPFQAPCQLAMANSGPNTNGSQFFITEVATPHLNPRPCNAPSGTCGYVHFGEGVCGCELVAQIARAGNSNTRLEKVLVSNKPPTCK